MAAQRKCEIGRLYAVRHKWLIPSNTTPNHDWQKSELAIYLGKKKVAIPLVGGEHFVILHDLLVDGKIVSVDTSFLRYLECPDESR